ncbi:N-acetylglucosamine-6-phosphate deacetylase [Terriglobus albidus]|uniref:N-acetylglucosamine-6-phosphate deacetylase n=1 Tax=Terriglobus albidus TaxID=1592106 RepID=UPI0021E01D2E|nr:N-acetylglucosamine-6-phosphate deacetylase [Terriglobus albidus]
MSTILTAARALTSQGIVENPILTLEDGRIAHISTRESSETRAGAKHFPNATITPALFDVHLHGAANHDVMEGNPTALSAVASFLATRGVGQFLPTTVTAPIDATLQALDGLADIIEAPAQPGQARPVGIHLEGPFVSHSKRGVHAANLIQAPSVNLFDRFYEASRGHIRLLTIAPEEPGAMDVIRRAVEKGVRVSIGHSNATLAETDAAIAAGAVSATHTFNAMRALDHREPGVLGAVLDRDVLFAELICDGVHVAPELVRLWLKAKGPHRGILVTDGISATGMPEGTYVLGDFEVTVANGRATARGVLAGSVLTLDKAIENVRAFTGTSLATAVGLASTNPATMLGLDAPVIAEGQPANLNLFTEEGKLLATCLAGTFLA